ncbi:hypothetical protein BOTBODRAFT_405206 [Botryobasidium botryosum FD-172 SS1]|uniref:Uncharacterized protein n=1 Tax=Botryobasidium botryosum (strain FD-172 SS1) TaxID=930990 RepID=A0A067MBI6_BOTB1|nr:hypothetical protein BOTBODRAFT_405206 [Botryobasidium botryosum FD-172 SS1]
MQPGGSEKCLRGRRCVTCGENGSVEKQAHTVPRTTHGMEPAAWRTDADRMCIIPAERAAHRRSAYMRIHPAYTAHTSRIHRARSAYICALALAKLRGLGQKSKVAEWWSTIIIEFDASSGV